MVDGSVKVMKNSKRKNGWLDEDIWILKSSLGRERKREGKLKKKKNIKKIYGLERLENDGIFISKT